MDLLQAIKTKQLFEINLRSVGKVAVHQSRCSYYFMIYYVDGHNSCFYLPRSERTQTIVTALRDDNVKTRYKIYLIDSIIIENGVIHI